MKNDKPNSAELRFVRLRYILEMQENLVIVESPAKAKTIEKFLGKGYVVKSSFGHIRDLSKKGLGVKIDESFMPDYEVLPDMR